MCKIVTFKSFEELENALGVDPGFYRTLLDTDDDWSFIIKTHAFLEGAVSKCLEKWFKDNIYKGDCNACKNWKKIFENSKLWEKVELAYTIELIDKNHQQLTKKYSDLRNSIIHHIENHKFSLIPGETKIVEPELMCLLGVSKLLLNHAISINNRECIKITLWHSILYCCFRMIHGKDVIVAYGNSTLPPLTGDGKASNNNQVSS